jgi:hypothetical protein
LLPDDRLGVGITSMQVKYKRARIRVSAVVQHDFATIR